MADTKISDLAAVTDVQTTDEFVLARAGATKKITGANLASEVGGSGGGAMELIDDIALDSTTSFTSIPGTYSHLRVVIVGRMSSSGITDITLRFNGDTGSNYDYILGLNGFNGSVSSSTTTGQTSGKIGLISGSDATSGRAGLIEVLIPGYAGTAFHKDAFGQAYVDAASSGTTVALQLRAMTWKNTAAITQVDISGSWASGSRAWLYGIA